ncbi:MAG TPA: hypothetical protein VFN48_02215 [Solirubrobacteraceae bacterium]|nr:hypothetical protein [Solirubrobacteraceae bacterium]
MHTAGGASARVSAVVAGVSNHCPGALSDLNRLSAAQLRRSALASFGQEIDADLGLAYLSRSRQALRAFAGALRSLSWPTPTQAATPDRLIHADAAILGLPHADLCADARTLDSAPLSEPRTTAEFLRGYRVRMSNQGRALSAFSSLLGEYETASESGLVNQIDALVSRYGSQSRRAEQSAAGRILSVLGVAS